MRAAKITGLVVTGILLFVFFLQREERILLVTAFNEKTKEVTVASCPTFYYMLDKLEKEGIEVVKTRSTAESMEKLIDGKADFFISGRALMPEEPDFFAEVIGPGFSFIYKESIYMHEKEMAHVPFYTDLSTSKIKERFPLIDENLYEVGDVYDYLEEGIGITSFENTDYSRSKVVHVFQDNGNRSRYSRIPVIYYLEKKDDVLRIKSIVGEKIRKY